MENKTPIKYIAIDSDILRTLTFLDLLHKSHKFINRDKIPDINLKKDFNYFERLYNCVVNGKIRLLIVDAVYQESKHSDNLIEFIKNYCYCQNLNAINYQEKSQKARQLANAYCQPYFVNGEEFPAPMKSVFVADINTYVPSNDCYIMAQATIEGCILLTGNGQDFVFNKRNSDKNEHDRTKGIVQINIAHNYYVINEKGFKQTSAPILIHDLGPILKDIESFSTPEPAGDLVKASELLM